MRGVRASIPLAEGQLLAGKYRLEQVIGSGGMGVVVAARHVQLGQRVAVKFLLPHAACDPSTIARFSREAIALARIESEHVTRVFDVGELETGEPYMVLERLVGQNLADILHTRGTLRVGEAVGYIVEACRGVAEAHAIGVVHRDIKPENLFLASYPDGRQIIKVIDFGISKLAPELVGFGSEDSALTQTSSVVGSPLYMSPEQLRAAHDVDPRSDVWSIGVTLYELLTGEGPFAWVTVPELCAAVLKDAPRPLRRLRPDAPEGLEAALMRCFEKDPAGRWPSVAELARALAPYAEAPASGPRQPRSFRPLSLRPEEISATAPSLRPERPIPSSRPSPAAASVDVDAVPAERTLATGAPHPSSEAHEDGASLGPISTPVEPPRPSVEDLAVVTSHRWGAERRRSALYRAAVAVAAAAAFIAGAATLGARGGGATIEIAARGAAASAAAVPLDAPALDLAKAAAPEPPSAVPAAPTDEDPAAAPSASASSAPAAKRPPAAPGRPRIPPRSRYPEGIFERRK